ncbi:MAG: hypothetical protein TYPL_2700 [Candidatus Tyloplasma litorale]|nr:MAG: hypothetical protein TYPL_2700 [Mycoplasmatales bacterium]
MIMKFFWTIVVAIGGFAGLTAVGEAIGHLTNNVDDTSTAWEWIVLIIGFFIAIAPAWFMWKGTKLIPIVSNIIIRILTIIIVYGLAAFGMYFASNDNLSDAAWICSMVSAALIVAFSLIGIWLK